MTIFPRVVAVAALTACSALYLSAHAAPARDPTPRIAVIAAFAPELPMLRAALHDPKEDVVNGVSFMTGTMAGKKVVLFLSGISMVNAAMTTQMALDRYDVTGIVFSGVAGGIDPNLTIGDVVVPTRWAQYLEAVFARKTQDGDYSLSYGGRYFPNFGMIFPQPVQLPNGDAAPKSHFWFEVSPDLLAVARKVAAHVTLTACSAGHCLNQAPHIVVGGSGVSGQAFVDNARFRQYVWQTFHADAVDMESAAIANVAAVNKTPFIVFRSLSDLAGGGSGADEQKTFFALAGANSAHVVLAFLKALPAPPR